MVDCCRTMSDILDVTTFMYPNLKPIVLLDNAAVLIAVRRGFSDKLNYVNKTRQIHMEWIPTFLRAVGARTGWVETARNIADIFTKILPRVRHFELLELMNLRSVKSLFDN